MRPGVNIIIPVSFGCGCVVCAVCVRLVSGEDHTTHIGAREYRRPGCTDTNQQISAIETRCGFDCWARVARSRTWRKSNRYVGICKRTDARTHASRVMWQRTHRIAAVSAVCWCVVTKPVPVPVRACVCVCNVLGKRLAAALGTVLPESGQLAWA